jgi:hypothetical protein
MALAITLAIFSSGCTQPGNTARPGAVPTPPGNFDGQTDGSASLDRAADPVVTAADGGVTGAGLLTDGGTTLVDSTTAVRGGRGNALSTPEARAEYLRGIRAAYPPTASVTELWNRYLAAAAARNEAWDRYRASPGDAALRAAYQAAQDAQSRAFDEYQARVDAELAS